MSRVADEPITEYVAQFACSTRFEDIPADVLRLAKKTLLDCMGLALAGAQSVGSGAGKVLMQASKKAATFSTMGRIKRTKLAKGGPAIIKGKEAASPVHLERSCEEVFYEMMLGTLEPYYDARG